MLGSKTFYNTPESKENHSFTGPSPINEDDLCKEQQMH